MERQTHTDRTVGQCIILVSDTISMSCVMNKWSHKYTYILDLLLWSWWSYLAQHPSVCSCHVIDMDFFAISYNKQYNELYGRQDYQAIGKVLQLQILKLYLCISDKPFSYDNPNSQNEMKYPFDSRPPIESPPAQVVIVVAKCTSVRINCWSI